MNRRLLHKCEIIIRAKLIKKKIKKILLNFDWIRIYMPCNSKGKIEVVNYIFNNYSKCLQHELAELEKYIIFNRELNKYPISNRCYSQLSFQFVATFCSSPCCFASYFVRTAWHVIKKYNLTIDVICQSYFNRVHLINMQCNK